MKRKIRRRQQMKLVIGIFVLIFAVALSSAFMFKGQSVQGSEIAFETSYKEVVVYYGDTIWDIAKDNYDDEYYSLDDYVDEIVAMNSMNNTYIEAGHIIIVPVVTR